MAQSEATHAEATHAEHAHPPYIMVWAGLFILTIIEVLIAQVTFLPKFWIIVGLVLLATWKALLVALYFMHLKFEPRRLWLLAAAPLPLATILVLAVLIEVR